MAKPDDGLVSIADAARFLSISTATVRRLIAEHQLELVRVSTRRVALRWSDIRRLIDEPVKPAA